MMPIQRERKSKKGMEGRELIWIEFDYQMEKPWKWRNELHLYYGTNYKDTSIVQYLVIVLKIALAKV